MLGFILTDKEGMELEFLIKKELDDILIENQLKTHHPVVQGAIKERYKLLLKILMRIAPKSDYIEYLTTSLKEENKFDKKC